MTLPVLLVVSSLAVNCLFGSGIHEMSVSPSGKYVATVQEDGTVTVGSSQSKEKLAQCFREKKENQDKLHYDKEPAQCVCFLPSDHHRVLFYHRTGIFEWEWKDQKSPKRINTNPEGERYLQMSRLVCSKNDRWLAMISVNGDILLIDKKMDERIMYANKYILKEPPCDLCFSPESDFVYFPFGPHVMKAALKEKMRNPESIGSTADKAFICQIAFDLNAKKAVSTNEKGESLLWDLKNGANVVMVPKDGRILNIAFSSDGKKVVSESVSGVIRVLEIGTKKIVGEAKSPQDGLTRLSFHPNGNGIFGAGAAASIYFWEISEQGLRSIPALERSPRN